MQYRADLYTSAGRIEYTATDVDELKRMITAAGDWTYVYAWRIVDVPTQKGVEHWSVVQEQLTSAMDQL